MGLSLEAPPETQSPAAAEGTRAHELAERVLNTWRDKGRALDGAVWARLRDEYVDTEDEATGLSMIDHVHTYVGRVLDEVALFDDPRGTSVVFERQLVFSEDMAMYGTADVIVTGNKESIPQGTIIDLKYGRGKKVKAEANSQLAFYAVALKRCSKKGLKKVRVVVVQPRISKSFTAVEYGEEELREWERTLTLGAEKALMQIVTRKAREFKEGPWCFFCPAKGLCPEFGRSRADRAADAFGVWEEPQS